MVHCKNFYYDSGEVFRPLPLVQRRRSTLTKVFDVPSFHGNGLVMRRDVLEEIDYIEPEIPFTSSSGTSAPRP